MLELLEAELLAAQKAASGAEAADGLKEEAPTPLLCRCFVTGQNKVGLGYKPAHTDFTGAPQEKMAWLHAYRCCIPSKDQPRSMALRVSSGGFVFAVSSSVWVSAQLRGGSVSV